MPEPILLALKCPYCEGKKSVRVRISPDILGKFPSISTTVKCRRCHERITVGAVPIQTSIDGMTVWQTSQELSDEV